MAVEFDCTDCGCHVHRFDLPDGAGPPEPSLCGHCLHIPGWMHNPQLREIFARDHEVGGIEGQFMEEQGKTNEP